MDADTFFEKHRLLVVQAEDLATAARRAMKVVKPAMPGAIDSRRSAHALAARRKLLEMNRVIGNIEKLAHDSLRPGDAALQKRVQDDLAALQLRQREALNEVTSAAASPANFLRPPRGEETADTRPRSDHDLLQAQRDGIDRQEETLDRVEYSVSRVHGQAAAVRDEVEGQVRLVETLDYDVDTAQGRVHNVIGKVEEVMQKMNRKLYYLALVHALYSFSTPSQVVLVRNACPT
eukprot:jgi/Ulvmu1/12551/UM090_0038.1